MSLNPPFGESSDGGLLNWVVPDDNAVQGKLSTKDKVATDSSVNADWAVVLDKFSFTGASSPVISDNNLKAIIDPFFPGIFLPQSMARAIYAVIPSSSSQPSANAETNTWVVPCDTKMQLTVTIGEVTVTLTENALIRSNGTSCISALEEWKDASASEYLFGATFISAVYLIYPISLLPIFPSSCQPTAFGVRNTGIVLIHAYPTRRPSPPISIFTVSGADTGSIGFGLRSRPSSSKLSGGAIAGIVIGSVATIAVAALVVVLLMRMFRKRRNVDDDGQEVKVQPFVSQRSDEQRGLLVPNTPNSPEAQFSTFVPISPPPTGYTHTVSPQPSMTTLNTAATTHFSSANSRYTLSHVPEMAVAQPMHVVNRDTDSAPPPYSGTNTMLLVPEQQPEGSQSSHVQRPMSASTRPGSAGTQSSSAEYNYSTFGPYGTNEKQRR
ncbi:hypothetical protein HGRIS_014718 [Hohenbuehelia grisea]|uniref:Peptidase A1 domain-containing protein n=1 Tax=Hohenbuehelia grisea TaxID=104357 RepID=A0ABR3IQI1_9AGAR